MKLVTPQQMREIDTRATEQLGIPSLVLMENAGACVVEEIVRRFTDALLKVTVICGPGNNGGDGMVISRHLSDRGHEVVTCLAAPRSSYKKDAKVQLKTISNLKLPVINVPKSGNLEIHRKRISESEIVVDALFGTGMEREVSGIYAELVEMINEAAGTVFSVDIPSGLNCLTGFPMGTAVMADVTVSLAYPKLGLVLFPGADYAGEVVVGDIGIPETAAQGLENNGFTVEPEHVCEAFPERWTDTHKGTYGHLLVVSGSTGRAGAGILASKGALRSGAGLVTLALPSPAVTAADAVTLEVMTEPLPETPEGTISYAGLQAIRSLLDDRDELAIGPGLTVH
ncbi:MAG: NAD(P)H-hydrate epimerase, partial [bacterium]